MDKDERKRPLRLAALLIAALAVALCLSSPGLAAAESVTDRVTQVTQEEQEELIGSSTMGGNSGGLPVIYAQRDYPSAQVLEYQGIADAVVALDAGRIDYALIPETMALFYMRKDAKYTYLSAGLYEFDNTIGLAKGNEALRDELSRAIQKLKDDGTIEAVERKWSIDGDYSMDDIPVNEDAPVLRVAGSATDEPNIFIKDGQMAGLDVEIAMRVAYEAGYRVEFEEMTFAAELSAIASGKVDAGLHCAPTEERKKQMCFTEPVNQIRWVAMTTTDEAASAGLLDSLRDNIQSTFVTENRWQMVLSGLGVTMAVALAAFALATAGGALLCWMGAQGGPLRAVAAAYTKIVGGVPVLVWLMVLYYIVFAGVDIPAVAVAALCFGLQVSAPLSGVFATGLASVDKGQCEAALAMGFSRGEAFRRVVLPQAARSVRGLYAGQLTSLIKATSVVGYVAIADLTKVSDIIRSRTFQAFFPLVSTALIYFAVIALCGWALGRAGRLLDPKLRRPERILKGVTTR